MRRVYFNETPTQEDLHLRSLRGGAVSVVAQGTNMVLQVASTIVLARLLLPEDIGLVAMAVALTGFATVFVDLGTRDAVAQRGTVNEGEISALFWITFGTGLALAIGAVAAAPLIARFYDESRLQSIATALSLTFLLPALHSQQYALMRRALRFNSLALIDVGANVLGTAIAVLLAYLGYGYWALVWKPIVTALCVTVGVWASCGWHPGRPTMTPGVREMIKFGLNITGFTMADYVARSADRVALGYTAGPKELGYYQNAFVIYDNPLALFTVPLHGVAVASLSKLREDLAELKRAWSTALSSLAFFSAPAFAILAVTAQDIVVLLLGSKWAQAGPILAILALRGPVHVVERTLGWLHVAAGRADRWRHWGFLSAAMLLVALLCGLPFGALGIASAYTVSMYILFVPALAYAGKPLGIGAADVLKAVGPQLATALATAAFGFLMARTVLVEMPSLARLLLVSAVCAAAYLVIMIFGFRLTKPLAVAASLVRRR